MADDAWLAAGSTLRIPRSELSFRATRAGGPGGQHVNTSSTRIELWWNLSERAALTEPPRAGRGGVARAGRGGKPEPAPQPRGGDRPLRGAGEAGAPAPQGAQADRDPGGGKAPAPRGQATARPGETAPGPGPRR